MKKIFRKSNIFSFILGAIIFSGITGVVAYTCMAKDVSYTPKDKTWKVDNVEDAIDSLYTKANTTITGLNSQISTLQSQNSTLTSEKSELQNKVDFYEQSNNLDCISKTFTATNDYTTDNGKKIIDFNPSSFYLYVKLTSGIKIYQMYNNLDNSWKSFAIFTNGVTEDQSEAVTFNSRYRINNGLYFHNMSSGWIDSQVYIMACK